MTCAEQRKFEYSDSTEKSIRSSSLSIKADSITGKKIVILGIDLKSFMNSYTQKN